MTILTPATIRGYTVYARRSRGYTLPNAPRGLDRISKGTSIEKVDLLLADNQGRLVRAIA